MNRRRFVKTVVAGSVYATTASAGWLGLGVPADDKSICMSKFRLALDKDLETKPIGDVITAIGKSFVGSEYVAHTLEVPGEERLVVNLRGFDCVSFYEASLTIARCVKKGTMTFEDYRKELQFIRYRGGTIDQYPSRLHYTSDYFYDNVKKGVWKNITRDLGGVRFVKTVDFMSTHPDSYRQLRENPQFVPLIRQQEEAIMERETYYIPKEKVSAVLDQFRNGDIIGTTTNMEGLDTSHTGIVIWTDGDCRFMHAPLKGGQVMISDVSLAEYLMRIPTQTGIMVVRPLDPVKG